MKDKNEGVRGQAELALLNIGPAAVPALTELLNDQDWQVRDAAALVLGQDRSPREDGHFSPHGIAQGQGSRGSAGTQPTGLGEKIGAGRRSRLTELLKDEDWQVRG